MLNPETFTCKHCGECCIKYIVKLSKADIEKIKKAGYSKEDFVDIDKHLPEPTKFVLKKKDNQWCVFLKKDKNNEFFCKIYNTRPTVCRRYPFLKKNIETCKPITFSK